MIGKVIGALFGAEMDRRNGNNGLKGAAIGMLATGVMRRMGPLGLILGGGYVAKKAYDRRKAAQRGAADID